MRLFGIIGYPLGHSFSEEYFTEKFIREGLTDCSYRKFPIGSIDLLPRILNDNLDLQGFNVTIPYKKEVMGYLHSLDAVAEGVGAVNVVTVTRNDGILQLKGYNSDAPAFRTTVERHIGKRAMTALVLGTGGASAAVSYSLEQLGAVVMKVSRTPGKNTILYSDLTPSLLRSSDLIVNTTPLGMHPDITSCPPIDYNLLEPHQVLYDVVYNPLKTEFLKRGEARGCTIINGMEMLHLQAELAWNIWSAAGVR